MQASKGFLDFSGTRTSLLALLIKTASEWYRIHTCNLQVTYVPVKHLHQNHLITSNVCSRSKNAIEFITCIDFAHCQLRKNVFCLLIPFRGKAIKTIAYWMIPAPHQTKTETERHQRIRAKKRLKTNIFSPKSLNKHSYYQKKIKMSVVDLPHQDSAALKWRRWRVRHTRIWFWTSR